MSKTKIFVIHLKEIIYTALFAGLGILLIVLLVIMFLNNSNDSKETMASKIYTPGVWNSTIMLNDTSLNLEVVLDADNINSIRIVNIDETITTMYPLLKPSLEFIATQLYEGVPMEQVQFESNSKFTQQLLLDAIENTLEKAMPVAQK